MQEEGEQNLKVTNSSSVPKTVSGKHFQFGEYCFSWLLAGYFCNNYSDSSKILDSFLCNVSDTYVNLFNPVK